MTKDELKPIDVKRYKVTETGQVLKMSEDELAKKADTNHALVSQLAELESENAELKARINVLEIYLEGAINYLILDGDVDNYIIDCAERILHTTFNRSTNAPTVYQKLTFREKRIAELEKENLELKEVKNNEDLATVAYMQGAEKQKKKSEEQHNKAKELIKRFLAFVNNEIEYDQEHPQEHTDLWNELWEQAEQFLKELEK